MLRLALKRAVGTTSPSSWRPSVVRLDFAARSYTDSASSKNEYVEISELPTDYFQNALPRLPVPRLEDTCDRYLRSQEAYMADSPVEFETTQDVVSRFLSEAGTTLQSELKAQNSANPHTSYIAEAWYEMYLAARTPLPINFSPTMGWADDFSASKGVTDPLEVRLIRLTNLVVSSLRFKRSLDENVLSPEVYHTTPERTKTPEFRSFLNKLPLPRKLIWMLCAGYYNCYALDVSQYSRLFCGARVPLHETDTLVKFGSQPPKTGIRLLDSAGAGQYSTAELLKPVRHITVLRGGHVFKVNVLDESGQIRSPTQIYAALRRVATSSLPREKHPIGVLSSLNRDRWAALRDRLRSSHANRSSLRDLESSIFTIAYDDETDFREVQKAGAAVQISAPGALNLDAKTQRSGALLNEVNQTFRTMLIGSAANRYWDKSFTLVSTANSKFGVTFEHSWGDGVAVLRYLVDTYANAREKPGITAEHLRYASAHDVVATDDDVRELRFELDDTLKAAIDDAKKDFNARGSALDNRVAVYDKFGKNFLKQQKLSPDSIAQLSVQLAYFKQYGQFGAAYESCSTAAYRHGRTEVIRPLSVEARNFIIANEVSRGNKNATSNQNLRRCITDWHTENLRDALFASSRKHGQLVIEAATGRGWDRHLFALRRVAEQRMLRSPKDFSLFNDPAYKRINHIILSTSTLSDPALESGGFGAVTPDGYGIGYAPFDDWMAVNVTNFPQHGTNLDDFVKCWTSALDDIHQVLTSKK